MELEARIAHLERELAELKATIQRGPFSVHDTNGRRRVALELSDHGASLKFFGRSGKVALNLGVDGTDSGSVALFNANGEIVAKLDLEHYGARLELRDGYWGGSSAVVLQGNDCDNTGGWIKILAPDREHFLNAEAPEALEDP